MLTEQRGNGGGREKEETGGTKRKIEKKVVTQLG